ncbi:MAG TPA: tyrosine-protein phosphatase [Thermomicrobiales bacterium]|jgi:protein-tyrosine phosphatase|nr:tyrosine-protein phosphatase [Thermomicrobiales bacterium]
MTERADLTASDAAERVRTLSFTGTYNFRDIGGYGTTLGDVIRWGQVFRSDSPHQLTDEDMQQLRPLGVRTIIDLRSEKERLATGNGLIHDEPGMRVEHIPFGRIGEETDPEWARLTLSSLYTSIVREAGSSIVRTLTTIARTDDPVVVHCAAGKDRTGVSIALLLRLLGVDDATVIEDYLITATNYEQLLPRLPEESRKRLQEFPQELIRVDAAVMTATLAIIDDDFGSTEAYLVAHGAQPGDLSRLRTRLLTRA